MNSPFSRVALCLGLLALLVGSVVAPKPATAGTTGTLVTFVLTGTNIAVPDARVSVTSPSQNETGVTDMRGLVTFVSLSPDTYTLTVSKSGYKTLTHAGVDVFADNTRTVYLLIEKDVKTIGQVTVTGGSRLVSPGTVVDVYSINRAMQATLTGMNGGGDLDQAYSSIAAVPGSFVPPNEQGWNQPIFIRGGAYNEIGYELDGVPMNRAYDNLPTSNLSTLGQQSVQVYTGGAPANAEAHGLSGYVNQVIRTGTYPGFGDLTLGYRLAQLVQQGRARDRRRDAGPALHVFRRRRPLRSSVPLHRQFQRRRVHADPRPTVRPRQRGARPVDRRPARLRHAQRLQLCRLLCEQRLLPRAAGRSGRLHPRSVPRWARTRSSTTARTSPTSISRSRARANRPTMISRSSSTPRRCTRTRTPRTTTGAGDRSGTAT